MTTYVDHGTPVRRMRGSSDGAGTCTGKSGATAAITQAYTARSNAATGVDETWAGSTLVVFAESGHFPFIEENERFLHVLESWLDERGLR